MKPAKGKTKCYSNTINHYITVKFKVCSGTFIVTYNLPINIHTYRQDIDIQSSKS